MATPTPFSQIYDLFQGRLTESQKNKLANTAIEKTLIINALPDFEMSCRYDNYIDNNVDFNAETINDNLTLKEKKIIGLLMLLEYYRQEKVKHSAIYGLISDSTKISGMSEVKKSLQQNYDEVQREINQILATLV